ncbi:hypothetical protein J3P77_18320 [Pseudomonas sp. R1-18]|uniref:hypothetical protein n=1 Tax=Pseudomonas sp. R1-18 TaxID=1632772 RepID=UPI003DAA1DA8
MNAAYKRAEKIKAASRLILIILPVLSFLISVWSWLRYGVDIPVYDDWRQYNANDMGRLDLAYLFTPHNDTLYTFGLLLDSLAFRFLDGNTVAYQFISMILVLGGLLLLQWKLLKRYAGDTTSLAIAFSFTLLMLQPDTYWGWQNLAYHQAIPLLCALGIFVIATSRSLNKILGLAAVMALGCVSGLSYISGAFSMFALSAVCIAYGLVTDRQNRKNVLNVGCVLIIPAVLTTAAQLWVIVAVQHGTHRADAPMAFPWESDFWLFMLGKVGRSLMLPMAHPTFSFLITVAATCLLAFICFKSVLAVSRENNSRPTEPLFVFISLCAIVFIYLLLISAGRTNLRPDTTDAPLEIFTYGFYRFHFFWLTLLWPWMVLLLLNWLKDAKKAGYLILPAAVLSACLWAGMCYYTNIIDNSSFYRATMKQRTDGIQCILNKIQQPGPIQCSNIDLGNIQSGIKNARNADASFARIIRPLPIPIGTNNPEPDYRLSANLDKAALHNAEISHRDQTGIKLLTQSDPSLTFKTTKDISRCEMLNISASLVTANSSVAQIFYLVPGDNGYNEVHSVTTGVAASLAPQQLDFTISSSTGFENQIRFDPVTGAQTLNILDLEVRCRSFLNAN